MKMHIITIGAPKHEYAKLGWAEYLQRLQHYHTVQVTHIADKRNTSDYILKTIGTKPEFIVGLVIDAKQLSSGELAAFLEQTALGAKEVCFIIGGPDGLQTEVIQRLDKSFSLSTLTFPHDLAMVILVEALYRASTITAGTPYHH